MLLDFFDDSGGLCDDASDLHDGDLIPKGEPARFSHRSSDEKKGRKKEDK
jgi:hypothetical protein